ncbi:uncharacterized protein LOC144477881, partial [Augochlora pura]
AHIENTQSSSVCIIPRSSGASQHRRSPEGSPAAVRFKAETWNIRINSSPPLKDNEIQASRFELNVEGDTEEDEAELETITENYDNVLATAGVLLEQLEARATSASPEPINSPSPSSTYAVSVNLPKIDLPRFDGQIETWVTFKDAFHTLIHTQPGLSNIQKLQYLRASLSGRAAAAIQSFSITESNYEAAWKHLSEIYDNKR